MKKLISNLFSLVLLLTVFPGSAKAQTNVATNGDFAAGNTGFVCGLPYNGICAAGTYFVGNSFYAKCSAWPNTYDHTLGTPAGSFFLVDGDPLVAFSIWSQNVNVCNGTTYTFSFWAKNIYTNTFNINMNVNGGTVMVVAMSSSSAGWTQFSTTWVASSTGTVPISLYCTTGGAQRDFGIDDIFFGYTTPSTTVTPSSSICSGSCTTLIANASGATSYSWSTGATSPSIVVCPGSTTTYTVYGIGCLIYTPATTTITVNPTPTVTATATPSTLNPPSVTTSYISSSASGGTGFTYSWTPSSSLSSGTVSNPVATPTTTTVYTEAVTNSAGCTGYTNVTVNVNPDSLCALTFDYDIPDGQNSATYFAGIPTLSGMNIRITGTFTINSSLMFSGCNVEMEPGSSIIVTGSTTMYITGGTHFYSCGGMWNGIDLQNGTSLQVMNTSIIEDAIKAVKINQGAYADIQYCIFNRNYTAVELTSNTSPTSPLSMLGCVVTSRDYHFSPTLTLNPQASTIWSAIVAGTAPAVIYMKTPYYGYKSIYGVYATDVNLLQVGNDYSSTCMNGFDNLMSTGIYLVRSNTSIYNNQFRNITSTSTCFTCLQLIGDGINASGSTSANYSLKVGGTLANQPNTFTDVRNSVRATNYQMNYILSNTITNSSTTVSLYGGFGKIGFQITPMSSNTIKIQNNNITNCNTCIWVNRNNSTSNQTVNMWLDNNTLTANASGFITNGIYVTDYATAPTLLPTVSEINFNTIVEAYNCIYLSNFKTQNNVISNSCLTRYAASGVRNGIKLVNCQQQSVFVNHTKYTVAAGSGGNIQAYGIFLQNSPNNQIRCNLIEQAVRSLVFDGGCTSINGITQNTMKQGKDGLVLLSSGTVIGSQGTTADPSNNTWDLSTAPVFTNTIVNNSTTTLTLATTVTPTSGPATVNPSFTSMVGPVSITTTASLPVLNCGSLGSVPARHEAPEASSMSTSPVSSFLVYPNPTNGSFTLETYSPDVKDVFVYDVMGRMVVSMSQVADNQLSIDIADQPAGIYLVKVVSGNSVQTERIVKQ